MIVTLQELADIRETLVYCSLLTTAKKQENTIDRHIQLIDEIVEDLKAGNECIIELP